MTDQKSAEGNAHFSSTPPLDGREPNDFDGADEHHTRSPSSAGTPTPLGASPSSPLVDVPPMEDVATGTTPGDEEEEEEETNNDTANPRNGVDENDTATSVAAADSADDSPPSANRNATKAASRNSQPSAEASTPDQAPTTEPATEGGARGGNRPTSSSTTAADGEKPATAAATAASPAGLPKHPAPDSIVFHKNPDRDDFGYKSLFESATNLQTIGWVRGAFRTSALLAFPLMTIAVHPNTMFRLGFPEMLIAAVVSTSTHRGSLGEQLGLHSWTWRGILYMLVFGTVVDVFQVQNHKGAWYGMLALGVFLASLVSHGMMRRFMYLYFFIYMMELRMFAYYFHALPLNNAAWSAADYYLGSVWGIAALCFPYPILTKSLVDMIMTKIFEGLGKMFMAMVTFVWMPDPHAAVLFFNDRSPFMKIEAVLEVMPPLLWFANWEPLEFPLRNPIRRLKLSLLRRIMALTYAAFGAGHTVAMLEKKQADLLAMHRIRVTLFQAMHGNDLQTIRDGPPRSHSGSDASHMGDSKTETAADVEAARVSIAELHENSRGYVKDFALAVMQATIRLGSTLSTPEQLLKKVPFDALRDKDTVMRRNLRLELVQMMKIQSDLVAKRRSAEQQKRQLDEEEDEDDDGGDVVLVDDNSPFGQTRHYRIGRACAAIILENDSIIDGNKIFLRMNTMFFHLQMSMIAGEILSFGEQMKEYKPTESMGRRLLRFFIIEPWNDFWEELWCRVAFVRPCDYRTVKDAIRMTCAYLSATALNLELWLVPGGLYFFGVTILLGLPVEEESLNMGVNRMAGNSLGCALGFMAFHNSNNLAQQLAMALCFTFIQQCCKNHPVFGQTFFYGSVITLAGLATSMVTMELLTRIIASNYTIVAYMLCCMFIFPNNSIKICWGYRCKLTKVMSEVIDDVALTLRIRPDCYPTPMALDADNNEPASYPHRNTEAMQMCSQLNVQMSLAHRLLAMCDKWAPFAARQHVIRGSSPFPSAASAMIQFAHKRMVAHLRLLVFGVQLLHRPRCDPVFPATARLVAGSVADFVAEFSDCVRLLSQDFIDSIQISRKWSYPLSLSRTSQLSRMRVRLEAIHSEGYVVVLQYFSKGTFGMTQQDFEELRREATERREELDASEWGEVRVNAGENLPDSQRNLSFADRFLTARRLGETLNGECTPEVLESLHQSMYLPQSVGAAASMHGGAASFVHRAPLQESNVQPNDAFPLTQESAECELHYRLHEERLNEERMRHQEDKSLKSSRRSHHGDDTSDRESHQPLYEPVVPQKTKSRVSKLILVPEQGAESYIPLYHGPTFTYVEDELATEKDTDFAAIMTILCSCDGLMTELEGLTGPVNTISTYQKQLHESSIAVGFLDSMTEKITAYRQKIYDRYHYPKVPLQKRDALHTQSDPWADWRF
ncbi:hypothetical protein ABB37_05923 [Leptomonas pyrrhocoris]|uniref:Uncharacterized protein n=1 Tax=Leptomonas pyrrhocoris TaxID=157538 RepID=A0A0N0VEN2_LEPPY|nr:hypothetical protein ABB37_05923 [Leptomonas pyrrhocoris]KPA78844.1 hypothetical protein ABB37_05923 [Leptomonas pyrrhocoris]|eukprot:XP_015657283.1 hypothetical protein ABB37_05923 [Leptomonas pyrrhocoris]